jgi:hypothetical protein
VPCKFINEEEEGGHAQGGDERFKCHYSPMRREIVGKNRRQRSMRVRV